MCHGSSVRRSHIKLCNSFIAGGISTSSRPTIRNIYPATCRGLVSVAKAYFTVKLYRLSMSTKSTLRNNLLTVVPDPLYFFLGSEVIIIIYYCRLTCQILG